MTEETKVINTMVHTKQDDINAKAILERLWEEHKDKDLASVMVIICEKEKDTEKLKTINCFSGGLSWPELEEALESFKKHIEKHGTSPEVQELIKIKNIMEEYLIESGEKIPDYTFCERGTL